MPETAAQLVNMLDGDVSAAAQLLGVTEMRVRNHLSCAAGVMYGMARILPHDLK